LKPNLLKPKYFAELATGIAEGERNAEHAALLQKMQLKQNSNFVKYEPRRT
jgi:hypothetical protein